MLTGGNTGPQRGNTCLPLATTRGPQSLARRLQGCCRACTREAAASQIPARLLRNRRDFSLGAAHLDDGDCPPGRPRGHHGGALACSLGPSHAGRMASGGKLYPPDERLLLDQHLGSQRLCGRRGCALARADECLRHDLAVSSQHVLPALAGRILVCERPPCQRDSRAWGNL